MPPSTLPHASGQSEKVHVVGGMAGQSPRVQDLRMDSRRESKLNTRFAGVRDSYYGTSLLGCVPWQLMYPAPEPFRQGLRGYGARCQNYRRGCCWKCLARRTHQWRRCEAQTTRSLRSGWRLLYRAIHARNSWQFERTRATQIDRGDP